MIENLEIYKAIFLQTGLLIVDSPGIADTGEMTDIVLGYLIKACAFIYVINSENAGGVAPDRVILNLFYKQSHWKHFEVMMK